MIDCERHCTMFIVIHMYTSDPCTTRITGVKGLFGSLMRLYHYSISLPHKVNVVR